MKGIRKCIRDDYERVEWGDYYDGLSTVLDYCYDNLKTSKVNQS